MLQHMVFRHCHPTRAARSTLAGPGPGGLSWFTETFFTPWHAVLYSGYGAIAAVLAVTLVRNHARGHAWRQALPPGYAVSFVGVVLFAVGGVLDMVWHLLFGIERSVEALLSP